MSVHVEVHQSRTVEEGPVYKVSTEVTFATGIERALFVFNTETQNFEHVATVWDMEHYPSDRNVAVQNGDNYYRAPSAVVGYPNQTTAIDYATYTIERVQLLVDNYNKAKTVFEGDTDYTLEAG